MFKYDQKYAYQVIRDLPEKEIKYRTDQANIAFKYRTNITQTLQKHQTNTTQNKIKLI